jgi:hypothetical protein
VHDAGDVVHRLVVHREAAVARAAGELDDVLDAVAGGDRVDAGRGVMTSAVVSRAKVRVRSSSDAVSSSSTPALAERRTRLESSSAVRAPDSSSLGSIPIPAGCRWRAVQDGDRRAEHRGERDLERHDELRGLTRDGEREVLRHELAEDHGERRGDGDRDGRGDDANHRVGNAPRRQHGAEQGGEAGSIV